MHLLIRKLLSAARRNDRDSPNEPKEQMSHSFPRIFISDSSDRTRTDSSSPKAPLNPNPPLLYMLGQQWAWVAIAFQCRQIQEHPEDHKNDFESLRHIDPSNGDTLLHRMLIGKPPREPIQAVLELYPELARIQNRTGLLPLHVACSYRVSGEVLRYLVEAYPDAACQPTRKDSYPLHILCDYGCEPDSILSLLETEQGIQTIYAEDGTFQRTPLFLLNERKNLIRFANLLKQLRSARELESLYGMTQGLDEAVDHIREDDFWRKACWLVLADYWKRPLYASDREDPILIFHAFVAASPTYCPSSLQECAILVYADHVRGRDSHGQVALHVAASRGNASLVRQLVAVDPTTAAMRNHKDETPTQMAIQRGMKWSEGLQQLVLANPAAINDLDHWSPQLHAKVLARVPRGNRHDLFHMIKATAQQICLAETM